MSKQRIIIGRAGDVTLYDDTVSRKHACLELEDGQMFLEDLDSRNGTYELRDKKLVPFRSGSVYPDQVFAFGECVRSIRQILKQAGVGGDGVEQAVAAGSDDEDPLDATRIGFSVPQRKRLTRADIIGLLEQVEDALEAGGDLDGVCEELGITAQRYHRWCEEHGATRAERDQPLEALRQENERLRRLISDLMLERETLRDQVRDLGGEPAPGTAPAVAPPPSGSPNFTVVGGSEKPT